MVRRIQVPWCVRSAVTFCVGFSMGALLQLGINMTFNPTQHQEHWSLLPDTPPPPDDAKAARNTATPRILCYVLTGPKTHQASLHVKNTWGQRCDKTLFFSTQKDSNLGTITLDVPEGYNYLWAKAKGALGHLHTHYPGYDWYLKADDDTFVIVENLRYFLKAIDPGKPVYYGVKFKHHVKQGYMSGGGGYVLSSEALRKFVTDALTLTDQTHCATNDTRGAEDLLLGECLESVGVSAGDSLDEMGRSRFFSHSPLSLFYKQPLINRFHWYWRYLWHKHGVGPDCCSQHLVSFHDINPRMMWTLETLLYRVHIHHDLQPPHLNTSTSTVPPPTSSPVPSSISS
ncbi:hypothetical protein Pmani_011481 [Petrolisthes manimaculis]|uniref:N-acetylgalactosaminide beta-1,3-galactosyltransferase n=1 Tax=Petrolisthes manimaculis TaxID=1843537 RepID=A0AAE1Q2G1_9EUCA|nr:hypothetical protein Pmani_011481 [Petrolisthes manimaculis]